MAKQSGNFLGDIIKISILIALIVWGSVAAILVWPYASNKTREKAKEVQSISREIDSLNREIDRLKDKRKNLKDEVETLEKYVSRKDVRDALISETLLDTDFVDIGDVDPKIKQAKHFKNHSIYTLSGREIIAQNYDVMALRAGTAMKLSRANDILLEKGYGILLHDAYRSYDVQSLLRDHYKYLYGSYNSAYVAVPGLSRHQKGAAVDVGLYDVGTGEAVEMPTKYLVLDETAKVASPHVSSIQASKNLKILQDAMTEAGFSIYKGEWWHFNDWNMANKVDAFRGNIENVLYDFEVARGQ